jgi:hypothetical protein
MRRVVADAWDRSIERAQSLAHVLYEALDERVCFSGVMQGLIIDLSLLAKVGRQIVIGVAMAVGSYRPGLPHPHFLPQRLQHTHFIIEPAHLFRPILLLFYHKFTPLGGGGILLH